jgi:hypothetical protein
MRLCSQTNDTQPSRSIPVPGGTLPKDWAKNVLDKVHYPRHKRRMSQPKLNELADSILLTLEDPEKFLRDITAEQTARQQPNALAAVAC